ncbi:hypothetical protein S40285_05328 [Stachybotrys chlorohalonatus IBT 40285]|uniref:Uncharacterized protein n=2 Tax=Stachybotrys TaxID=74721 RepID=A0A084QS29_STAC4|nr:hypothetical protein S7711_00578 [Stachybotrys chartarum IBT 7711]KFA49751.1 hypothetical protein S40293_01330 [Stachybotrys chartarum IBT 40293]KFA66764.1 hypothetical protein S40285_05328 [Stachybotrys chlorohalonata IBT 40285]KFA79310.1 hypothetical protein S40288_03428 [Stachybotrys chartarum IBT 40288]
MAPKDMRRADLAVPYQEPPPKSEAAELSSTMSSTLPMAAMFMRNKFIGWIAVVYSIQTWLGESEESRKNATTPGYLNVGMAFMSLIVNYLPLFLPPPATRAA